MSDIEVRTLREADRPWAVRVVETRWGSRMLVSRGQVHDADDLPAFVAVRDGESVGLATYCIAGDECELVSLDSLIAGRGIGSALLAAVRDMAARSGCQRLWLITTNDNVAALRFYQKRGFSLVAIHRSALDTSRRLKPQIPLIGLDGIPLRDEMELEMGLSQPISPSDGDEVQ